MAEVVPSSTIANNSGSPRPMSEMTNLSSKYINSQKFLLYFIIMKMLG